LHHLVQERYPRFEDALSDLDDSLTLTYLFAALPSTTAINAKMGSKAKALAAAWGAYCATAGCITKSFISVKGVYLEASVRGIPIRWVVPHSFTQFLPEEVDYRVMATFFEFYETLLQFVLFKLYNDLGVRYPLPEVEAGGEVKGSTSFILSSNLRSLTNALNSSEGAITKVVSETIQNREKTAEIEDRTKSKTKEEKKQERKLMKTVGAVLDSVKEDDNGLSDEEVNEEEDVVDVAGPLKAALDTLAENEARTMRVGGESSLDDDALKRRRLFGGLTFFLSREMPRGYLELVALAYGAKVGWEGPNSPISIKDPSITHHIVDRPKLLSSYDTLPKSREFLQPQWILDCANVMFLLPIDRYSVGATLPPHLSPWVDNDEEGYKPAYADEIERLKNGESIATSQEYGVESEADDVIVDEEVGEDDKEDESDEEEDEGDDAEAKKKESDLRRRKKEEKEAHDLARSMMSRKAAHLYGRMQHGIAAKQAKVDTLTHRRLEIEQTKEKNESGKTMLKQKVERLKKERKRIEDDYSNTGGSMKKNRKKMRP
jgi:pescadillo